jgi:hypothetical protein
MIFHSITISPLFNIILPFKPKSSTWSFSFNFPQHNPVLYRNSPRRAARTAHLTILSLITGILVMGKTHEAMHEEFFSSLLLLSLP